ncbi:MAG: LytTR family DNA-binding domain-containing protein [Bacteroidota bacterium]
MMKVCIIDDEKASVTIIQSLLEESDHDLAIVGTANSISEGIALIKRTQPDLVFLDIEFPEGLGFEILRATSKQQFHTVFITAFEEYALEAIKVHALDYILKPVDLNEFQHMVNAATERIKKEEHNQKEVLHFLNKEAPQKIGIPSSYGMIYIEPSEIIRIKADGTYSEVYLKEGSRHLISRILKSIEATLKPYGFLRVHRAHLINMAHVASINRKDGGYILMSNRDRVPVARKDKERVFGLIAQNATCL